MAELYAQCEHPFFFDKYFNIIITVTDTDIDKSGVKLSVMQTLYQMSRCTRKPSNCICVNKDADQLRSNCEADQRFYFRHMDSTIPLLLKSEISSF